MTEKNTLSILQNIKKKMQKFDQEPKKIETVAGINDEFEYIPSSKAKSDVKIEVADNSAAASNVAAKTMAEIDAKQAAAESAVNNIEDDLGLDDLSDLEDHQPAVQESKAPVQAEEIVAEHDDLSLDIEEKNLEEADDDLDFNLDLDLDLDEEIHQPEPSQTKAPEPEAKKPEEKKTEQEIDDLDLDKLLAEEEAAHKKAEQTSPAKPATLKPSQEIDIDDEEFLKDISVPAPAKTQASQPQKLEAKNSITNELLDDIDLDELDDIEDKIFADAEPEVKSQLQEKNSSESQDILEDELEIELQKKKEEVAIPPLDMENVFEEEKNEEKPYKSPDDNLEAMLQNQNFAEIAMHILEPKLDSWLDEHLHGLVEKIVQEEVKKLFEKR